MYGVTGKHHQTSYAGLKKSLQQEWAFVQCITPDTGSAFQPVEDEIRDAFLLALFREAIYQIPGKAVTGLPVNQDRISLPDPTYISRYNWTASYVITGHLVAALYWTADFWSGDHALLMG